MALINWLEKQRGWILAGLFFLDAASVVLMVAIALNQQATIDKVHDGVCSNTRVLIQGKHEDIQQTKNTDLYKQFFPQIPADQLKVVIGQQLLRDHAAIKQLRANCAAT